MKIEKMRITKILIFTIGILYSVVTAQIFLGDRLYNIGYEHNKQGCVDPEKDMVLLRLAERIVPLRDDIIYLQYQIIKELGGQNNVPEQINDIKRCINICPLESKYHIAYALTLELLGQPLNVITKNVITEEIEKGYRLDPTSEMFEHVTINRGGITTHER
ncbi:MAG TPA: hypothetical protein PKY78_00450 [Candidatus Omnitrophota bacterium]|nr:hypothetical protein [Candidatus Omnitrophota bacterium]